MPKLNITLNIHILDCTEISVNLKNENYEESAVCINKYGDVARGYKLAILRGLNNDNGIIEEICFGSVNVHDFKLCKDMLHNTTVLKLGDILGYDGGSLDRDIINFLKTERGVDIYIPLKRNMDIYQWLFQQQNLRINGSNIQQRRNKRLHS